MPRIVLLSRDFSNTLDELVDLQEEVNGILLYRPQKSQGQHYCPIEAIFMTGIGSEGHVHADQQRMDIVNVLFSRNPEYNFVKFHTHSRGTTAKFGDYYATHFSRGDIDAYNEQLKGNRDFIGMVVTPRTKLLYGRDNPRLIIVSSYPFRAAERINEEIQQIAIDLGCDLGALIARFH